MIKVKNSCVSEGIFQGVKGDLQNGRKCLLIKVEIFRICKEFLQLKKGKPMIVQRLGLHTVNAEGDGSIPDQELKILQASWHSNKKKGQPNYKVSRELE